MHTKAVLDQIQQQLERVGSSMEKVLKCNVYLNDLKDYAGMNEMSGPPRIRATGADDYCGGRRHSRKLPR